MEPLAGSPWGSLPAPSPSTAQAVKTHLTIATSV